MIGCISIYTDKLPSHVGGRANGPFVRIKPQYRNDTGIHAHEFVHVRQWYAGVLIGVLLAALLYWLPALASYRQFWWLALPACASLHSLAYQFSTRYRLWAEVQAFKEQARHYSDDRRHLFSLFICQNYGLTVTPNVVFELLST